MALTPFGVGTITTTALRANFDDKTTALLTNARAGAKSQIVSVHVETLVAATVLSARTLAWTQADDQELRIIWARGSADAANRTISVTLTVDHGDTVFLVDQTVTASVTSAGAGVVDTRTAASGDYRTTTGTRLRLLRGVRYRLTLATDAGTYTSAEAGLQLVTLRRRA